jgi:glyoxalase family protein
MNKQILGIHHITAIAGDPQTNLNFYAGLLGLRLVKLTVNFDDPTTYHLYYGDGAGHPGTILTFFPWPSAPKGRRGAGQVTETAFAIPEDAVDFWIERLPATALPSTGHSNASAKRSSRSPTPMACAWN